MAKRKTPQITITSYLIKEDIGPHSVVSDHESLEHRKIGLSRGQECNVYIRPVPPHSPRWTNFFTGYVEEDIFGMVQSTAAVLLITVDGRLFAVTFGQGGRFLLEQDSWEQRYGLMVVLSSIEQNQIKTIDKSSFDALTTHAKIQASEEAAPQDFGFDVEQDLLRAVTGTPTDSRLGHRLTGMDALKASVNIPLDELPQLLGRYLIQYHSGKYKETFPWIDHIAHVRSKSLETALDDLMVAKVRAEDFDNCWMAVPEIVEWAEIDGFRYGGRKHNAIHHDIHLPAFIQERKEIAGDDYDPESIDIEFVKRVVVRCHGDDDRLIRKWPIYKCIYCEVQHEGRSYFLSSGKWYRVDRDFVDEVNNYFDNLPRYEVELPEYDDPSEGGYNARICNDDPENYALMDQKFIYFGGAYSRFEFCDLYSLNKDIVHVKRYGQSKVFSHFFAQGTNSAELFHTQVEFRRCVNEKLPSTHRIPDIQRVPEREEYRVVFAVVSEADGDELTMPFFSRLNLRAAANRLIGYGYRVAVSKIGVNALLARNKRYKS